MKPTNPLAELMRRDARCILWGSLILSACFLAGAIVLTAAFSEGLFRTLAGLLWVIGLLVLVFGTSEVICLQRRAKRILAQDAKRARGR